MLKVTQAAFAVACFWVLSDVHECWGDLLMAPSPVDKQPAGYKSPHDWLLSLAMDLATLCGMWRCKWLLKKLIIIIWTLHDTYENFLTFSYHTFVVCNECRWCGCDVTCYCTTLLYSGSIKLKFFTLGLCNWSLFMKKCVFYTSTYIIYMYTGTYSCIYHFDTLDQRDLQVYISHIYIPVLRDIMIYASLGTGIYPDILLTKNTLMLRHLFI